MCVKMKDGKHVIIIIYMGDVVVSADSEECVGQTEDCLKTEFEMIDFGILHYFLGIEVWQTFVAIIISQRKYAIVTQKSLGLMGSKSKLMRMESLHTWWI